MIINPLTFLLDFFNTLINMVSNIWRWLFEEVNIGIWKFRPIIAIGGSLLLILIVAKLVKEFVPLA